MRKDAFRRPAQLDATLHWAFDYEFWIRLSRVGPFAADQACLARSRMHAANKTLGSRRQVFQENIRILRRHYQYVPVHWVYGYLSHLRDRRDQFFQPLRRSAVVYLASLPAGSYYNRGKLRRYWMRMVFTALDRQAPRGELLTPAGKPGKHAIDT